MNVLDYLKTLLPGFKRGSVETDARQILDLTKRNVIPSFKKLAGLMHGKPFTTDLGKRVELDIQRAAAGRGTSADILFGMFQQLPPKLDYILKIIDEEFEPDVSRDNMTYKQSTIVRFLELARFGLDYSMRMGSRLVTAEARLMQDRAGEIDAQLTPAEVKWFDSNYKSWLQVVALLCTPLVQLRAAIEKMPNVVISEVTAAADEQAMGAHRLDPLRLGFSSGSAMTWNPIYHFRLMRAELQIESLRASEKEAMVLELHILELQLAQQQAQDPKLQQQIEYHTGRLQTLRAKIQEAREEYGLT